MIFADNLVGGIDERVDSDSSNNSSRSHYSLVFELSSNSKHHELDTDKQSLKRVVSPARSNASVSTEPLPLPLHESIARLIPTMRKVLPCEFVGYFGCNASFGIQEFQKWIDHIVHEHLHSKYPQHCICWFCDDAEFIANPDTETDGLRYNYRMRMRHIHKHFAEEGLFVNDMRPDFFFTNHLQSTGIIDSQMYKQAGRFVEGPAVLRGIHQSNFIPPEFKRKQDRSSEIIKVNSNKKDRGHKRSNSSTPSRSGRLGGSSEIPSKSHIVNSTIRDSPTVEIQHREFESNRY